MSQTSHPPPGLVDPFGRRITYLRLSVTDRCDLRCIYCMGTGTRFVPRDRILSLEELLRIGRIFVALGVDKIRITGGEPLVRRNLPWLLQRLAALPGLRELVLTTNGTRLAAMATDLRSAGVRRINVSLDTLRPERYRRITHRDRLPRVLDGIDAALAAGFERIKLNTVILPDYNADETGDLLDFALKRGLDITFIEEMPLGRRRETQDQSRTPVDGDTLRRLLGEQVELVPSSATSGGPARYFELPGRATRVGFISPISHPFCADCNRVRVTVEGKLLPCLGHADQVDLHPLLRTDAQDDGPLVQAIRGAIARRPPGHAFQHPETVAIPWHMNRTGG